LRPPVYREGPALILVNDKREVRLALFESVVGSIKVEVKEVRAVECPSPY
jgi:hypothetical protein